jgi:hypothetical protein
MTRMQPDELSELDSTALLEVATQAGTAISDRMLETFRAQGLILRPQRVGYRGRAPMWLYPAGTDRQLLCLLRWRRQTKDPDTLKVLLWLDGFPIPVADVRQALIRHLGLMSEAIEREITTQAQKLGLDLADPTARLQSVSELGRMLAAKRGPTPIQRRERMRAGDRAHAVAMLLRVFGLGETVKATAAEGEAAERILGIGPNGRRHSIADAEPWLTGPAEDLFGAAGIVGLPRLLDVMNQTTDEELETARQAVIALFRYLPLLVRMMTAMSGQDNYAGLAAMEQVTRHPESALWLTPALIAMLKAGWGENISAITAALEPFPGLAARAQAIADMPEKAVKANLAKQPPEVREQAERIIDAVIDGRLDMDES